MKAKIDVNDRTIQIALEEYFTRLGFRAGPGSVRLTASPSYTATDQPTGGYTISATVEVVLANPTAQ